MMFTIKTWHGVHSLYLNGKVLYKSFKMIELLDLAHRIIKARS